MRPVAKIMMKESFQSVSYFLKIRVIDFVLLENLSLRLMDMLLFNSYTVSKFKLIVHFQECNI